MNLYDAMNLLKDGQAAKTAQMLGYVKRVDAVKASGDTWKEKYDIVFVERTGTVDNDNHTSYKYTHQIETNGTETVTGPFDGTSGPAVIAFNMDVMLYRMLRRSDWTIVSAADAESVRDGTNSRW